ncbi:MAG: rod shape-determining protein MreD [Clostridia bacterium]|nr:rod shape-determining protein MreD [Clostridia bacterium]
MTLESHRKKLILRRICLALILLLISVIQNTDGFFPQIFGVRALLLIPFVVCISMFERDIVGLLLGLFAGALWDIFASGGSFNALFLTAVGFICGTLINTIMRNNVVTAFILSFISTVIYNICYWLFHYIFDGLDSAAYMLLRYYLPSIAYTVVLVPLIFIIVRSVEKKFSEE